MTDQAHSNWRLETIAVHGGYRPDPTTRAVAVPIYQTGPTSVMSCHGSKRI
ncbi:hypothetical protein [Burkholderia cenocepacia]|uniref:hypothetical protein n=1 Tax=Burkholderia cenocepacia TaxID=95486 RepID=UPI000AEE8F65|nr:hypothetical protein [Burkholderia cenocepacia]MBR7979844.1 hypothetical protein [Burkholderia cenocepacia]MBR7995016.1 hypothetical protein [Burkholderia cenocepacia]